MPITTVKIGPSVESGSSGVVDVESPNATSRVPDVNVVEAANAGTLVPIFGLDSEVMLAGMRESDRDMAEMFSELLVYEFLGVDSDCESLVVDEDPKFVAVGPGNGANVGGDKVDAVYWVVNCGFFVPSVPVTLKLPLVPRIAGFCTGGIDDDCGHIDDLEDECCSENPEISIVAVSVLVENGVDDLDDEKEDKPVHFGYKLIGGAEGLISADGGLKRCQTNEHPKSANHCLSFVNTTKQLTQPSRPYSHSRKTTTSIRDCRCRGRPDIDKRRHDIRKKGRDSLCNSGGGLATRDHGSGGCSDESSRWTTASPLVYCPIFDRRTSGYSCTMRQGAGSRGSQTIGSAGR